MYMHIVDILKCAHAQHIFLFQLNITLWTFLEFYQLFIYLNPSMYEDQSNVPGYNYQPGNYTPAATFDIS